MSFLQLGRAFQNLDYRYVVVKKRRVGLDEHLAEFLQASFISDSILFCKTRINEPFHYFLVRQMFYIQENPMANLITRSVSFKGGKFQTSDCFLKLRRALLE